jgi:Cu-Zn family superoxide dismutase
MLGQTGLVEGDRSALIIHANPDDHITQPNGDAGGRVACAELR